MTVGPEPGKNKTKQKTQPKKSQAEDAEYGHQNSTSFVCGNIICEICSVFEWR